MGGTDASLPGPPDEDLEDLYENAPCGYLSLQADGSIFKANLTFASWVGCSRPQLVGMPFHQLLNVAGRIFFETHVAPLLRMQGFFNEIALDLVTRDGGRMPVLINATERRDGEGRHLFTRLTVFNATDRRRFERELVEARAAAEAARTTLQLLHDRAQADLLVEHEVLASERATSSFREQFIAVLGHDLRNPLAAIDGGMRLLRDTSLDERALVVVDMVQSSIARMAGLIDNIMDFARGRLGGGLTLERRAVAVGPVLRQVVAELQAGMPGRVIESTIAIAAPVDCDPRRMGQLASNLLANALTHGAEDEPVRMTARQQGQWFELSVANGGEPIPPAQLERIFEPFARAAARPSLQGLGLGLYIAQEIAKAHGGTLDVVSTQAETCFTFRMPQRSP